MGEPPKPLRTHNLRCKKISSLLLSKLACWMEILRETSDKRIVFNKQASKHEPNSRKCGKWYVPMTGFVHEWIPIQKSPLGFSRILSGMPGRLAKTSAVPAWGPSSQYFWTLHLQTQTLHFSDMGNPFFSAWKKEVQRDCASDVQDRIIAEKLHHPNQLCHLYFISLKRIVCNVVVSRNDFPQSEVATRVSTSRHTISRLLSISAWGRSAQDFSLLHEVTHYHTHMTVVYWECL